MSDKELLEKAAKAAGYDLAWGGPDGDMARRRDTWDNWNPLFNDGDALRLAVKLGIGLEFVKGLLVITNPDRKHEDRRDYGDDLDTAIDAALNASKEQP